MRSRPQTSESSLIFLFLFPHPTPPSFSLPMLCWFYLQNTSQICPLLCFPAAAKGLQATIITALAYSSSLPTGLQHVLFHPFLPAPLSAPQPEPSYKPSHLLCSKPSDNESDRLPWSTGPCVSGSSLCPYPQPSSPLPPRQRYQPPLTRSLFLNPTGSLHLLFPLSGASFLQLFTQLSSCHSNFCSNHLPRERSSLTKPAWPFSHITPSAFSLQLSLP